MRYYITLHDQTIGPMTVDQMMAYPVDNATPVCEEGGEWKPLYAYPQLMAALQNRGHVSESHTEVSSKKILCGIMAILFGTLGLQYFVIGKVGGGFLTILLSCITCGVWGVITLIQGILILCMSDQDFKRKYLDSTSTLPLF